MWSRKLHYSKQQQQNSKGGQTHKSKNNFTASLSLIEKFPNFSRIFLVGRRKPGP